MEVQSYQNINKSNDIKYKNIFSRFDNILSYIILICRKKLNNNCKKSENQIKKRKINLNDRNKITLIKFLIFILFFQIKSDILLNLFDFQNSKITLKINGSGIHTILGNFTNINFKNINNLKEVYINEIEQDKIEYKYDFNQTENLVELIWDDNITNCENMFRKCSYITEIDLSYFNTSQVTNMNSMFSDCSSLTLLYFSIFNTSQVTTMNSMFSGCSSLTSLDLSYFNTSQVTNMNSMFSYCSSLTSLDLSYFKTPQLRNLNKNVHH